MKNLKVTGKRKAGNKNPESSLKKNQIAEEDIRKRAFEISQSDDDRTDSELDDWLKAERELSETDV